MYPDVFPKASAMMFDSNPPHVYRSPWSSLDITMMRWAR